MDDEAILIAKILAVLIVSIIIIMGAIVGTVEIVNLITVPVIRPATSFNFISGDGLVRVCQITDKETIIIKCLEPVKND